MPHDTYEDQRAFNTLTGHQRTPWRALDAKRKQTRYTQAVRAFDNGVLKNHPGTFAQFARRQKSLDAHQKPPRRKQKRSGSRTPIPWIFRRGGCERILISLAANGPMTVRELARAINSDPQKTGDVPFRHCAATLRYEGATTVVAGALVRAAIPRVARSQTVIGILRAIHGTAADGIAAPSHPDPLVTSHVHEKMAAA